MAVDVHAVAPPRHRSWPLRDESRAGRLVKVAAWVAGIALVVAALGLVGVDVRGWFSALWGERDRIAA